ncbi:MAG: 23S rRNA (guanosine(2251)-2'-O)-methyltransferase RlmB [Gammaproteobacteria bacterium]|nr:23S rRNA (guanosine(2251)-2'-O)-methyltransferase RlmB [Gammaproteobacteria bacterium]
MVSDHYWITGIHAVNHLLRARPSSILRLLLKADRGDQRLTSLRQLAYDQGIKCEEVKTADLVELLGELHRDVAAQVSASKAQLNDKELFKLLEQLDHEALLLVLDGVTDPHNLGACLRTADAAGVDAVIIPKDKSAGLNGTVSRVASGAAETVSVVQVTNLARCLKELKQNNLWIVGTDENATTSIFQQDLKEPTALIVGSEGKGLRRLTRKSCDFLISIPMVGKLSSLNVSVATGVALFEAVRQRQGV